jgi:6-phosphogluconolactonase
MPVVLVHNSLETLYARAAEEIARCANEVVLKQGRFSIALSGGNTPRGVYERLAAADVRGGLPWDEMHFFWGDERHVPPDHPESNYRMAWEAMLSRVPVPPRNIHRIPAEIPEPLEAASRYEGELSRFFDTPSGEQPRFDLVLLGIGEDGHTASLFPGTEALSVDDRSVAANWVKRLGSWRITLTLPAINRADRVLIMAAGKSKRRVLRTVLRGSKNRVLLPVQRVRPSSENLTWMVDSAAAEGLV